MRLKKSIISTVLALALANALTGCGGGSQTPSNPTQNIPDTPNNPDNQTQDTKVLGGIIDLGNAVNSIGTNSKKLNRVEAPNCGTSASVQLYDIEDIDYKNPLLKNVIAINTSDCRFDINSANFLDKSKAGINGKYIIRTVVIDGDKKVELSAAKVKDGLDAGRVDPVATLIKAKFIETIRETKESLAKLEDLGVTQEVIAQSIEKIIASFEENLENTVAALKKDIEDGKIKINPKDFETKKGLGESESAQEKVSREERAKKQREQLENSSATDNFEMIDNILKKDRLDSVVLTPKDLKGKINEGVATLKFGIIESFVKLGLPVHDGQGNLIVFMPTNFDRQGELPGKIYSLNYYNAEGKIAGSVGSDFAIRVINPEIDLAKASGFEEWFWDLGIDSPKIPNSIIDTIILNKDHKITLETLGKKLNGMVGKSESEDGLSKLYTVTLSSDIEKSATRILSSYKTEFLKQGYDRALWNQVDNMFRKFNGEFTENDIVNSFLQTPFIVQDDEDKESFQNRIFRDKRVIGPIADKIGSSLANGIPAQDRDPQLLQFKDGYKITSTTQVKPMAALALINLFMETQGDWSGMVFTKKDLIEQFGWMAPENGGLFKDKQIWMLDFLQTNAENEDETLNQRADENKRVVIDLVKLITGVQKIDVERKYNDMIKEFHNIIKKIEQKRDENSMNSFETSFKGDMVQFDEVSKDASVTFSVVDFENTPVLDLNLKLVPLFEDTQNYMWIPVEDQAIDVTFADGKYSADNLKILNPTMRFNEKGEVLEDGRYRAVGDYEFWIVDGDKKFPIGTFPLFAGENNLDMPIYYDRNIDYGMTTAGPQNGITNPAMPTDAYFESFYLEDDKDLFFPFVTTSDDEIVGENILHFDWDKKEFSVAEKKGKLSDAKIVMTIINRDYESVSAPTSVDKMVVGENIKEGAIISLLLSGPQIQTQTIDMIVNYVSDDAIAVDFVKMNQGNASGQNGIFEMLKDRFSREDRFMAEFNGKRENSSFEDLTFDETDQSVEYLGEKYILMLEDFDSVTMTNLANGEFAIFRFIKEQFRKALDITQSSISGKELLFEDDYIVQKFIFLDDGTFRTTMRDKMFKYSQEEDQTEGRWSVENGIVILEKGEMDRISLVNSRNNDDEEFGVGDTIIFAFTQDSRIEPTSPEHKVIYLGKPRNDDTSFSYIEYPVYNDDYIVTEPTIVDPINL